MIENNLEKLKDEFLNASPFEHIDNFCNEHNLYKAIGLITDAQNAGHNKSND
jgi:hypothetical protein